MKHLVQIGFENHIDYKHRESNWTEEKKTSLYALSAHHTLFFVETNDNFFSCNLCVQADVGVMCNWATGIADHWQDNEEEGVVDTTPPKKNDVIYDYDWNSQVCPKN